MNAKNAELQLVIAQEMSRQAELMKERARLNLWKYVLVVMHTGTVLLSLALLAFVFRGAL